MAPSSSQSSHSPCCTAAELVARSPPARGRIVLRLHAAGHGEDSLRCGHSSWRRSSTGDSFSRTFRNSLELLVPPKIRLASTIAGIVVAAAAKAHSQLALRHVHRPRSPSRGWAGRRYASASAAAPSAPLGAGPQSACQHRVLHPLLLRAAAVEQLHTAARTAAPARGGYSVWLLIFATPSPRRPAGCTP